jgi:hypothetical protein
MVERQSGISKSESRNTAKAPRRPRPREKARIIKCFAFVEILLMAGSVSSQYAAKTHSLPTTNSPRGLLL